MRGQHQSSHATIISLSVDLRNCPECCFTARRVPILCLSKARRIVGFSHCNRYARAPPQRRINRLYFMATTRGPCDPTAAAKSASPYRLDLLAVGSGRGACKTAYAPANHAFPARRFHSVFMTIAVAEADDSFDAPCTGPSPTPSKRLCGSVRRSLACLVKQFYYKYYIDIPNGLEM